MRDATATLPPRIVWFVVAICVVPEILYALGVPFAAQGEARSVAIHTLLEWTAVCVALVSVHFSFMQFSLGGDASTPIIGLALFFSGMMDAFHTLAVNHLIYSVADNQEFVPFTWAISRIFNAVLIVGGVTLLLLRPVPAALRSSRRAMRFVLLMSLLFGLVAYGIIHVCAVASHLPQVIFPGRVIPRPWDAIPLLIYLVGGGIVLPRFHREHPSLFTHGLMVSILPQIAAQCHAAFGSTSLYDGHANIASFLKIVAYQVPFYGLMLDYRRAYRAESSLRSAEEKLRIAREVQQGILPDTSPALPGFELAGLSLPADVMGGDFFDYIPLRDGCWGIVVADVTGHDVGASALMAQTRAYVRAQCQRDDDPATILEDANRFVVHDVRDNRFCTLFFARLDPHRRSLRYAAAGHDAWIIDGNDVGRELPPTGPPLGAIPGAKYACGGEVELSPGAVLLMTTDGIIEAESLGSVPFGAERLLNAVRARRELPASGILRGIVDSLHEHTGSAPQNDDLTVVVAKVEPLQPLTAP